MSLVTDVQEILGEAGGATFWTKDHIYDALNDALFDEYTLDHNSVVVGTSICSAGNPWMNIPSNVMIPQTISYNGQDYWPTTYAELERYSSTWKGKTADRPIAFVPVSWNVLRVWPVPDARYEFIVRGVPWPTEITTGTEDVALNSICKRAVELKAASRLVRNTLPLFARMWEAEALEEKAKWKKHQRNRRGKFRFNRLRPVTNYTVGQRGAISVIKSWS